MSDEIENTPAAAPWADDLRAALGEEHGTAFDAVDGYLRERWQPRVTSLEEETKDARELWNDLQEDAPTTIARLVGSVYDEEFVDKYLGLFGDEEDEEETPETPAAETPETPAADGLTDEEREWLRSKRESEQAKERDDEYTATKRSLLKKHDGLSEDDLELIDPFIYSSPDDLDAAAKAYLSWKSRFQPAAETPEAPTPPAVLGSEGAPAATPPAKTQYEKWGDLGDALDGYFERNAATKTPPPVIG